MTFSELRAKDVINVVDGRKLGHVVDLRFHPIEACVEAIIVPAPGNIWGVVKGVREGYVIPWKNIARIGDDVILVEVNPACVQAAPSS